MSRDSGANRGHQFSGLHP